MGARVWTLGLAATTLVVGASLARVGAADLERGKASFDKCAACHTLGDEADLDGPALKGVMGRPAGSLEGYRYSAAMKRSGITWNAMTLDAYVADPQGFIKGNRMAFAGIADEAERADLIAYIEQASTPAP